MCCPLDQIRGNLVIQNVTLQDSCTGQEKILQVKGFVDHTPPALADRIFRYFQRLELVEKIAEIADESFHLFGSALQRVSSVAAYQAFRNLHNGAHDIEHLLHAVCFLGDISRLLTGRFLEYRDAERTKLDFLRSIARVSHAAAHFLASLQFLVDHSLIGANRFQRILPYMPLFSAAGYGIWTATLIWRRHQGEVNERFASDLGIQLGGFLFAAVPLAKHASSLEPYTFVINKISAFAGIVHAWCVVDRLIPQDRENVTAQFNLAENFFEHLPHQGHEHADTQIGSQEQPQEPGSAALKQTQADVDPNILPPLPPRPDESVEEDQNIPPPPPPLDGPIESGDASKKVEKEVKTVKVQNADQPSFLDQIKKPPKLKSVKTAVAKTA